MPWSAISAGDPAITPDENDTVALFYSAATGQSGWDEAFAAILEQTGFEGSAFYVIDRSERCALTEKWLRLDTSYADSYLKDYLSIDPRGAQVFDPHAPRILFDYLHTQEAEIDRHPFYAWLERSQGTRYYVGGQSGASVATPVTLTLHRSRQCGHATPSEIATFDRLFAHFERAVWLEHRIGLDATRTASSLATLEDAAHGIVLLDSAGRILFANHAAQRIAARADGLVLSADSVSARSSGDAAALAGRIAAAARGEIRKPLLVARQFGGHPYIVSVFCIHGAAPLLGIGRVAFTLRIFDPDAQPETSLAKAAPLLGLTLQETRILEMLLAGHESSEIATLLALKTATVRTYLAAIYRKTGLSKQAALVLYADGIRRFLG